MVKTCSTCLHKVVCIKNNINQDVFTLGNTEDCKNFISEFRLIPENLFPNKIVYFVKEDSYKFVVIETIIEEVILTEKGYKFKLGCNSSYKTALSAINKTVFFDKNKAKEKADKESIKLYNRIYKNPSMMDFLKKYDIEVYNEVIKNTSN